jgi:hypothetical protein
MKFEPIWYNQDTVVKTDPPVEAKSREEAERKAYMKYDGKPPAPMLYLKEL